MAKLIRKVDRVSKELDSQKVHKDYLLYFKQAILQLHVLNDPVQFELFIGKMKSVIDINKLFQKNYSTGLAS